MENKVNHGGTEIDLVEWIKEQLGYPTRNVELTESQLNNAVNFALQEVQPWYTVFEYLTIDLNGRTAIPLSEYDVKVYEVTDVLKVQKSSSNSLKDDPFNTPERRVGGYGIATGGYINTQSYISRLTNSDIHHVISSYAKQQREVFYTQLAQILARRTEGTISPSINYEFYRTDQTLYIGVGYPPSTTITIEYNPYIEKYSEIKDNRYRRCCQDLALGQAMITLARIVGKYNVNNAPASINYDMYREDGKELIEHAREELKRISLTHFATD